jgi:hypothetical protein
VRSPIPSVYYKFRVPIHSATFCLSYGPEFMPSLCNCALSNFACPHASHCRRKESEVSSSVCNSSFYRSFFFPLSFYESAIKISA